MTSWLSRLLPLSLRSRVPDSLRHLARLGRHVVRRGQPSPGIPVELLADCRAADLVTHLAIPPIASAEAVAAAAPISGQLKLLVPDVMALPVEAPPPPCAGADAPTDHSAVFCVTLRDAGGHESAAACTAPIPLL